MSRRPPAKSSGWAKTLKAARKHTTLQGEVLHGANLLHDRFFAVFAIALALEREDGWSSTNQFHDHAVAIWHSVSADSAQREMALAAISTVPTQIKLGPAIARLQWAKKKASKLAEYRNLLAHNPVMFRGAQTKTGKIVGVPTFGGHGIRARHRAQLDLMGGLSIWRTIRNDFLNLSLYVEDVYVRIQHLMMGAEEGAILYNAPKSWPGRPRLRSLPRLLEIERKLAQAAPQATQRIRQRALRRSP